MGGRRSEAAGPKEYMRPQRKVRAALTFAVRDRQSTQQEQRTYMRGGRAELDFSTGAAAPPRRFSAPWCNWQHV